MKANIEVIVSHDTQEDPNAAWQLIHHVPGRSRYHLSLLVQDPELGLWLTGVLQRDPKVKRAQVRWQTGSVIIEDEGDQSPTPADLAR